MPKRKNVGRKSYPPEDEVRSRLYTTRMTPSQVDEITETAIEMRISNSALIRGAARMVVLGIQEGKIDIEEFIKEYASTT